jgi:replicative DNA helicase
MRGNVLDIGPELGKIPPQAPEIEQAILGAILLHDDIGMAEVGDLLRPEVFYVDAHKRIYAAIEALYAKGVDVDLLTVAMELKARGELEMVGGAFYISQLTNKVSSSAHLQSHTLIVLQNFISRETIRLNSEAMSKAYDGEDAFDVAEATIRDLENSIANNLKRRAVSYADAETSELERMDAPKRTLHTTGFRALDRVIGGYQRGDLIIIAARPAMGKSSFATSSVMEAVERSHHTGLFSLELNAEKMQARLFSRRSGVPLAAIVRDELTPAQMTKRHEELGRSKALPLWIRYDSGISLEDVKAESTRMVRNHKVGCIVIDQLNWIKAPRSQNRDAEVGSITRSLKQLAMQLDIAVVLLHQLNRSVETRGGDKRPLLSDLRDSGNVEQDAQVVMFLYRPEYYGITEDALGSTIGLVEVIVAKNSNGPCDTVRLKFNNETASVHEDQPAYDPMQGFNMNRKTDNDVTPF